MANGAIFLSRRHGRVVPVARLRSEAAWRPTTTERCGVPKMSYCRLSILGAPAEHQTWFLSVRPVGSFDWLVSVFKGHHAWRDIDQKTRRLYEQGLSLVSNYVLKDGSRVGSKQIANFTRAFVDGLYAKLLVVEERDETGNVISRERRRFANAAMTACRRAWFIGQRAAEKIVPELNPFAKMGLKAAPPR